MILPLDHLGDQQPHGVGADVDGGIYEVAIDGPKGNVVFSPSDTVVRNFDRYLYIPDKNEIMGNTNKKIYVRWIQSTAMHLRTYLIFSVLLLSKFTSAQVLSVGSGELDLRRNDTGDSLLVYVKISEIISDQGPEDYFDGLVSELKFTIRWAEESPAIIGGLEQFCNGAYNISIYQNLVFQPGNGFNYITLHAFGLNWISSTCPEEAWPSDEWKQLLKIRVDDASCEYPFQIVNDPWTSNNGRESYLELNGMEVPHSIDIIPAVLGVGVCGNITGNVYADLNSNCVFDGNDIPIPNRMVTTGDNNFCLTNSSGQYYLSVPFGDHTVQQIVPASESALCPPASSIVISVDPTSPDGTADFFNTPNSNLDLQVTGSVSFARPGFPVSVWMTVKNISYFPSGPIQLGLTFDPLLTSLSEPDGTWELPALAPFQQTTVSFSGTVPADPLLEGYELLFTASISNPDLEETLANNSYTLTRTITNSYDPNDKVGTTNATLSNTYFDLLSDEWIDYTIRFQNTGSDTAFNISITDTISMLLDITSLEILGSSHDLTTTIEPERTLVFDFADILLPDSTTDLLASQGYVSYRMKPVSNILPGEEVTNSAGIYFDFNPAIITNTTSHVIELGSKVPEYTESHLQIFPNPATDILHVIPTGKENIPMIEVLSMDGRVVSIPIQWTSDRWLLEIKDLSSGLYMVRSINAEVRTGTFLKL
jgi:hypothetical protein